MQRFKEFIQAMQRKLWSTLILLFLEKVSYKAIYPLMQSFPDHLSALRILRILSVLLDRSEKFSPFYFSTRYLICWDNRLVFNKQSPITFPLQFDLWGFSMLHPYALLHWARTMLISSDNLAARNSHIEGYTVKQYFTQTHTENQIHNLADTFPKHC